MSTSITPEPVFHLEELKVQRNPDSHIFKLMQPGVPDAAFAGTIDGLRSIIFRLLIAVPK